MKKINLLISQISNLFLQLALIPYLLDLKQMILNQSPEISQSLALADDSMRRVFSTLLKFTTVKIQTLASNWQEQLLKPENTSTVQTVDNILNILHSLDKYKNIAELSDDDFSYELRDKRLAFAEFCIKTLSMHTRSIRHTDLLTEFNIWSKIYRFFL